MASNSPTFDDVVAASKRMKGKLHVTQVPCSTSFASRLYSGQVVLLLVEQAPTLPAYVR